MDSGGLKMFIIFFELILNTKFHIVNLRISTIKILFSGIAKKIVIWQLLQSLEMHDDELKNIELNTSHIGCSIVYVRS